MSSLAPLTLRSTTSYSNPCPKLHMPGPYLGNPFLTLSLSTDLMNVSRPRNRHLLSSFSQKLCARIRTSDGKSSLQVDLSSQFDTRLMILQTCPFGLHSVTSKWHTKTSIGTWKITSGRSGARIQISLTCRSIGLRRRTSTALFGNHQGNLYTRPLSSNFFRRASIRACLRAILDVGSTSINGQDELPFRQLDVLYEHILNSAGAGQVDAVRQTTALCALFESCQFGCVCLCTKQTPEGIIAAILGLEIEDVDCILEELSSMLRVTKIDVCLYHASVGDFLFDRNRSGKLWTKVLFGPE